MDKQNEIKQVLGKHDYVSKGHGTCIVQLPTKGGAGVSIKFTKVRQVKMVFCTVFIQEVAPRFCCCAQKGSWMAPFHLFNLPKWKNINIHLKNTIK